MKNFSPKLAIIGGILLVVLLIVGNLVKKDEVKTEPLGYSVINQAEYGIASEPGYKLTLLVEHEKWTKTDLLETAITEIKAIQNNYKYKEFTVFVNDTNSKYLNMSLYRMETTEKPYNLKTSSFTFDELPSQEPKSLKTESE